MIRRAAREDAAALLALADSSGLFPPHELEELGRLMAGHLDGDGEGEHVWVVDEKGGEPAGLAYYAPERLTEGTWNLYLIAFRPEHRGRGRGTELVRHVERDVAARGGRLLIVETAGLPEFEPTRAFYRRLGFEEEARIREFYAAGVDKVVYRKPIPGRG